VTFSLTTIFPIQVLLSLALRGHRRRAGRNDVLAVVARHDHQLKIAVGAISR
jgi:hypothetical protein